jgi:nitroimidazol reductase NimA-like FMN-containing flavoprotein (pyridoxamine 5'-phosphate oxidase superfamily)
VTRLPERGHYDRVTIDAILDEGIVCHLGFVHAGVPFVIPTLYARAGDDVLFHGSAASRALRTAKDALPVCLAVTLIDGLVLARSAFHHSANYRSVVLLGNAREITDAGEKLKALETISEHLIPGRWAHVRAPSKKELLATSVLKIPIDEASAKIREGGPGDEDEDYALDVWAGVIPFELRALAPVADERLRAGIATPPYAKRYARPKR